MIKTPGWIGAMYSRNIFLSVILLLLCVWSSIAQSNAKRTDTGYPFFYRGAYIETHLGYAAMDWDHYASTAAFTITQGGRGGFVFDIDSGYQYNQYLGFEAGWYHLPTTKYSTTTAVHFTVSSWFAYLALKLMLPIYRELYLFTKAGFSYRSTDFASTPANVPPDGYNFSWQPVFAVGGQVYFNPNWFLTLQYWYVPSRTRTTVNNSAFLMPRSNLFTVGLAYKFAV